MLEGVQYSLPRMTCWLIVALVLVHCTVPALAAILPSFMLDYSVVERLPAGYADDVSRLDKTQVAEIWNMPSDSQKGEDELRQVLRRAQVSHLHISVAGARHSMGGQTIYPGGIQI